MRWMLVSFGAFLISMTVLMASPEAEAGRKVIVFDFQGSAGGTVRDRLVKALLSDGMEVVPRKEAKAAAENLGMKSIPVDPLSRLRIANALGVDAFLAGDVSASGKMKTLIVEVYVTCESGQVRPLNFDWVGSKLPADTVALAVSEIGNQIELGVKACWDKAHPPAPVLTDEQIEEETKAKRGKTLSTPDLLKSEDHKFCKLGGFRCGKPEALQFDLGVLVSSRSLSMPSVDPDTGDTGKYGYKGSAYALIGLSLKVNILRFLFEEPRAGFGVYVDFANSVGLVSHPDSSSPDPDADIRTTDRRIKAGLFTDVALLPSKKMLFLYVNFGIGLHEFLVNFSQSDNPYITNFRYQVVDLGFGVKVYAVKRYLEVSVGIDFRIPYSLGSAETFYGASASGKFGYSAGVRLGGVIVHGLRWDLGFDYIGYMADFKGQGMLCQEPNPSNYKCGDKLTDTYPTGYFMLGYRL